MNILILGNGFDIAHKLPTKYTDFLAFAKKLLCVYTWHGNLREYIEQHIKTWNDGHEYLKEQLENIFARRKEQRIPTGELGCYDFIVNVDKKTDAFRNRLVNNIWFNYISEIYKDNLVRGENWIDFESEISFVIQALDRKFESLEDRFTLEQLKRDLNAGNSSSKLSKFCDCYRRAENEAIKKAQKDNPEKKIMNIGSGTLFSLRHLRDRLYDDLEHLILAFEFYLVEFVEKIHPKKLSFVDEIDPSHVITFNYTKTFERLYTCIYSPDSFLPHIARICHVHGECNGYPENENCEKSSREESDEKIVENAKESDQGITTWLLVLTNIGKLLKISPSVQILLFLRNSFNELGKVTKSTTLIGQRKQIVAIKIDAMIFQMCISSVIH